MNTILHISKYYYPDLGGIETVALYLAEGLTQYNNVVVCFSTDGKYHEDNIHGITVYRVPVNMSFLNQDIAISYYSMLKRLIRKYNPFAVHVHCPNPFVYPLVVMAINKYTKLVLHWHSDILSKGLAYYAVKPFEDRILHRADIIISTSPNYIPCSKPLMKYPDKVRIAQNGLICSNFDLQPGDLDGIERIRAKYAGRKIVYFVGRHIPYKGIDCLIKADAYIESPCAILIAGSGPQDDYLKSIPCSDRVQFLGRLSDDELRLYSHAAHVFAFPSVNKAEAFGIALAEAMYCYNAPVTFTIEGSGVNWVSVAGETGEEVPLGDVKAFAAAIDRLLQDDDLRNRYAKAAHQRIIDHFTEQKAVEAMAEIYREI